MRGGVADLAIKCATHSGSNVGRKSLGSKVPEADTFGISRLSQARFAAIPNPPMRRRVYDEVWGVVRLLYVGCVVGCVTSEGGFASLLP